MVVDIGALEEEPTDTLPGFTERLLALLPGPGRPPVLARPGRRLRRATGGGHLGRARHRARRAGTAAHRRAGDHPRQDPLHRRARRLQRDLRVPGRDRRDHGRPARGPAGEPPGRQRPGSGLRRRARDVPADQPAGRVRAVHPGDPRGGDRPRHPLAAAQLGVAGAVGTRRAPAADPGHHDLADRFAGGRHRLRQGADEPAAGRRWAAGPDIRAGAQRRRGRPDRPPDRLPGRASSRWTATTGAASRST